MTQQSKGERMGILARMVYRMTSCFVRDGIEDLLEVDRILDQREMRSARQWISVDDTEKHGSLKQPGK